MIGIDEWMSALERRHLAELTFQEVSRSLRALSSNYVERRTTLTQGAALSGAGKRAAFALFYGPLHFLLVRHIVAAIPGAADAHASLVDLGCGTGAGGAAWASVCPTAPPLVGIDRNAWAVEEARFTYRAFGLRGRVNQGDLARAPFPPGSAVLAAFAVNELDDESREALLTRMLAHAERAGHVLVVEPLAGFVAPWWKTWRPSFERLGGRAEEWRVTVPLPPLVANLDRAAGLRHREVTGRSLWI